MNVTPAIVYPALLITPAKPFNWICKGVSTSLSICEAFVDLTVSGSITHFFHLHDAMSVHDRRSSHDYIGRISRFRIEIRLVCCLANNRFTG